MYTGVERHLLDLRHHDVDGDSGQRRHDSAYMGECTASVTQRHKCRAWKHVEVMCF
jgi:hypothetical protein